MGEAKQTDDGVTILTGKKDKLGGNSVPIPEFMRLEPDEQAKRMEQVKGKLVDALKPNANMVEKIGKDPQLMSGERCLFFGGVAEDFIRSLLYFDFNISFLEAHNTSPLKVLTIQRSWQL